MDTVTALGSLAAICSIVSFMPQAWKIVKSRDTRSISTGMYAVTVTGFALWLSYGVLLSQWPLIVTNSVCLAMSLFILVMKLLPQAEKEDVADKIDPDA